MSLKDLFIEENTADKSLINVSAKSLVDASDVESSNYLQAYVIDKRRIIPDLDLSDPKNFARFGRAEFYYEKAFEHIQDYYPYDGSDYEKLAFQNSGSILDMYILDKNYPKTTGYVTFGANGSVDYTGTESDTYKLKNSTNPEYILFKGGPNAAQPGHSIKDDISDSRANVYDESTYRMSNLYLGMPSGSTIEFWMKKNAFAGAGFREVVFDLWNSGSVTDDLSANEIYGRLNISCIQSSTNTLTFYHRSGSASVSANLDTGLTTLADGLWHHYAVSAVSSSTEGGSINLFVDGKHAARSSFSTALNEITGAMHATLGAAVTQMDGDDAGGLGWGKLSGSIDEFRYWKKARSSKEIQRNWKGHVGAGANIDDANTSLGVYYKFNEGITGTASIDQTVLDYSGRATNGKFTGYDSSYSRSTGSGLEESGNNIFEPKDPIIYSFHPDVLTTLGDLKATGAVHDYQNTSRLDHMIPSWILDSEDAKDNVITKYLMQVLSFYFDELSMQITNHSRIKNVNYMSGSITGSFARPLPYARRLLNSQGFIAPEIFTQAEYFENLQNKNDDYSFSGSLDEIKNIIYNNIYNNLGGIHKSKGTRRSITNLMHCIGIDEDIFKINLYSSGHEVRLENNFKIRSVKSRMLDFAGAKERFNGTAYQFADSNNPNSQNYISGTFSASYESSLGYSVETEVIFPPAEQAGHALMKKRLFGAVSSSIFGQHTAANEVSGGDLTFGATGSSGAASDFSHFSVYAVRPAMHSADAAIVVTGSKIGQFETETIKGLYNGAKYNIVFSLSPRKSDYNDSLHGGDSATVISSSTDGAVRANIVVASTVYDKTAVFVTASKGLEYSTADSFLKHNKRVYVGAHYQNFTGSALTTSDVKINSCRVWMDDLDQDAIIAHNRDLLTFGARHPGRNINKSSVSLQGLEVPQDRTLALYWNFSNNTGSNASGQMTIFDESSGSADHFITGAYGWIGRTVGKFHSGMANFFPASDSNIIDIDYISTARQSLPGVVDSDDMTQILSGSDDVTFMKSSRPTDYVFSIEKSFYQNLSEEILNFFATIEDFHSLIGQPINRYRQEYKDLGKLRQLLFQKFEHIDDIEKFVNYYKWFDSSMVKMIQNLVPASARFTYGVSNVIESHVLERNKYWNKFPTLEHKLESIEGTIRGREELKYKWQYGHAPILARPQAILTVEDGDALVTTNGPLAEKDHILITSADGTSIRYIITDESQAGARTTGQPITAGGSPGGLGDTGAGIADHDGVAVSVKIASSTETKNKLLVELRSAIRSVSGHNGKISVPAVPTEANGAQSITLTDTTRPGNPGAIIDISSDIATTVLAFSSTPVLLQNNNCRWWSDRAEKTTFELSSSNASVNVDRQTILEAITTNVTGAGKQLVKYNSDGTRTKYQAFRYANRSLTRHQDFITDHLNHPNRRNQPHENKKYLYWRQAAKFTPPESSLSSSLVITGSSIHLNTTSMDGRKDCADQSVIPTSSALNKFKYNFTTAHSGTTTIDQDTLFKGRTTFPFTLFSGSGHSVASPPTYAKQLSTFKTDLEINNLHHDQVHPHFRDAPLQSPFTEHHVGGNFYRHVPINSASAGRVGGTGSAGSSGVGLSDGLHSSGSRPEGWALKVESDKIKLMSPAEFYDKNTPRAGGFVFRNEAAKRPVNLRNILVSTASNQGALGNYSKGYQIFQTSGRKTNNLWFRSGSDGSGGFTFDELQSPFISGAYDWKLPVRVRNEHVFVERFSAPGGAEVMSRGMLDPETEQFALYNSLNNRNLLQRRVLHGTSGSLLTSHTLKGGYDSHYGSPSASFHKTHKNARYRIEYTTGETVVTSSTFDNGYINRSIPASDRQYSWITSSLYSHEIGVSAPLGHSDFLKDRMQFILSASHAQATLLFYDYPALTETIVLTSTDGTTKTYTAAAAENLSANEFFRHAGAPTVPIAAAIAANSLKDCIEHSAGHNGKIQVLFIPSMKGESRLKLTQKVAGQDGETAITNNVGLGAVVAPSKFIGGSQVPVPDDAHLLVGAFTWVTGSSLSASAADSSFSGAPIATLDASLNVLGLNINTSDPLDPSTNTLGHPLAADIALYKTGLAGWHGSDETYRILGNASRFVPFPERIQLKQRFDGVLSKGAPGHYHGKGILTVFSASSGDHTGSATLNALLLRRGSPGGFSSWKQVRTSQHPAARYNRSRNILTVVTKSSTWEHAAIPVIKAGVEPAKQGFGTVIAGNGDYLGAGDAVIGAVEQFTGKSAPKSTEYFSTGHRRFVEPPVTVNKPLINYFQGAGAASHFAYSYTNAAESFSNHFLNLNLLSQNQLLPRSPLYRTLRDASKGNPPIGSTSYLQMTRIKYAEVIFPKKRFAFLSGTRGRERFEVEYWRNDRYDRAIPGHFYANSMGQMLAASGNTADLGGGDGTATEGLQTGYGYGGASDYWSMAMPNSSVWPLDAGCAGSGSGVLTTIREGVQICDTTMYKSRLLTYITKPTLTFTNRFLPSLKPATANNDSVDAPREDLNGWALPECADSGELQAAYQTHHLGELAGADIHGGTPGALHPDPVDGEDPLLNSISSSIRLGSLLTRRVPERAPRWSSSHEILLAGDTKYQVTEQAAYTGDLAFTGSTGCNGPFYETYEDYAQDIRVIGKDYSIVPEFRMSEYIGYYVLSQSSDFSIVNTPPQLAFLGLTGSSYDATTLTVPFGGGLIDATEPVPHQDIDFLQRYSTADFMKMFSVIREDFDGTELGSPNIMDPDDPPYGRSPSKLTLKCDAVMKFLPYDGFYPFQRAMALGRIFSASFGDHIKTEGAQGHPRTLFNPLFAPGILYNSLKSGIACDWPIMADPSHGDAAGDLGIGSLRHGYTNVLNDVYTNFRKASGSFDHRIPFDFILRGPSEHANPGLGMTGVKVVDQESHPSASLDSTASFTTDALTAPGRSLYTLAANNFFSELVNFYKEGGALTSFKGSYDNTTGIDIEVPFEDIPQHVIDHGNYAGGDVDLATAHAAMNDEMDRLKAPWMADTEAGQDARFFVQSFIKSTADPLVVDIADATNAKEYRMRVVMHNSKAFSSPGQYLKDFAAGFIRVDGEGSFVPGTTDVYGGNSLRYPGGHAGLTGSGQTTGLGRHLRAVATTDVKRHPEIVVYERTGSHPMRYILSGSRADHSAVYALTGSPAILPLASGYDRYIRGSSYGPAHSYTKVPGDTHNAPTGAIDYGFPYYAPYTPPYFNGLAYAEYVFKPDKMGYHTAEEILARTTVTYRRVTELYNLTTGSHVGIPPHEYSFLQRAPWISNETHDDAMQISASIGPLRIETTKGIPKYNAAGEVIEDSEEEASRVVLNTKFECPMLDYSKVGVELPTYGSGSVARGWGHQYGDYDPTRGVWLEIQDIPEGEHPADLSDWEGMTTGQTGSLKKLLGFGDHAEPRERLGKIRTEMTVHEAVVAIPFRVNEAGAEQFFPIPADLILGAKNLEEHGYGDESRLTEPRGNPSAGEWAPGNFPSLEIIRLRDMQDKYVFPPRFSWLVQNQPKGAQWSIAASLASTGAPEALQSLLADSTWSLPPITMYVFEFGHKFNQKDMLNMWQGLPPNTLGRVKKATASITTALMPNGLFAPGTDQLAAGKKTIISDDVQWIVFKVKQRAKTSYNKLLNENKKGISIPQFSYNWPYDHFSMVEMIKLESELEWK